MGDRARRQAANHPRGASKPWNGSAPWSASTRAVKPDGAPPTSSMPFRGSWTGSHANAASLSYLGLRTGRRRPARGRARPPRVLVSFGGEDFSDLTGAFLEAAIRRRARRRPERHRRGRPLFGARAWPEGIRVMRGVRRLEIAVRRSRSLRDPFRCLGARSARCRPPGRAPQPDRLPPIARARGEHTGNRRPQSPGAKAAQPSFGQPGARCRREVLPGEAGGFPPRHARRPSPRPRTRIPYRLPRVRANGDGHRQVPASDVSHLSRLPARLPPVVRRGGSNLPERVFFRGVPGAVRQDLPRGFPVHRGSRARPRAGRSSACSAAGCDGGRGGPSSTSAAPTGPFSRRCGTPDGRVSASTCRRTPWGTCGRSWGCRQPSCRSNASSAVTSRPSGSTPSRCGT